ncbi:hypothetical protein HanRHA438_Chr11g0504881 [Helianthus annuus]|nr:hypothetical protein HanRHA438_Chr11g0504881 [Helianthus annuus]
MLDADTDADAGATKENMNNKQKDVKKARKDVHKDINMRISKRKQVETTNEGFVEVCTTKNRRLSTLKANSDKDVNKADNTVVDVMCYLKFYK